MASFSDNLGTFLRTKGMSIRAFEQQIGCSNGVISRCINKGTDISSQLVSKIIETFPDLNPSWLLLGKGSMLNKNEEEDASSAEARIRPEIPGGKKLHMALRTVKDSKKQLRPRIPLGAAAGYLSYFAEGVSLEDCEMLPVIKALPQYDFTIFAKGDSMSPDIISGDELACRFIHESAFIQWGRIYVLDTTQGVVVKRVFEKGSQIIGRSINKDYPDYPIDKADILHMALVIGLIRQL